MPKSGIILAIILAALAVLLMSGVGIINFNLGNVSPKIFDGIGATVSAVILTLIIGMDMLFIVLIARTPNRQWEP